MSNRRTILASALLLLPAAAPAAAQFVSLKTVPVATGDQFLFVPSRAFAMGGVSIALTDPLGDAWSNPALGVRLEGRQFFSAPAFYGIGNEAGAGRTLPLGVTGRGETWFGGGVVALQQLEAAQAPGWCCVALDVALTTWSRPPELLGERSSTNGYAAGFVGRRLAGGHTSVGLGGFAAGLDALEGVELLYPGHQGLDQGGSIADVRLGILHEAPDESALEAVLLYRRLRMRHEVSYREWVPGPQPHSPWQPRDRLEHNLDHTDTYGTQLVYHRPVGDGWRGGVQLTGNYKTHPKIPNYELMRIPRDPGTSWATSLGVGLAREAGPLVFGVDALYEPAWSHTWAEAEEAVTDSAGGTIPAGGRTVENDFRFDNAALRLGVGREAERFGIALGLEVRAYGYELDQEDHVQRRKRHQEESWTEWSPTWGASLKFPDIEIRYAGRRTTGVGRPGVMMPWGGNLRAGDAAFAAESGWDIMLAPSGPLTLQEVPVMSHQISVSLPM